MNEKHECPICGRDWGSREDGLGRLLICETCYLTPMHFAVANVDKRLQGLGLLKSSKDA